ncbi:MAG: CYTH domain-containing protein [Gammaproteobacteria bacterium]|nr:CYTH domain-containing protein [Gammaproteobacteria bacterium]
MATEIERKLLIKNDAWRSQVLRSERITQGYLNQYDPNVEGPQSSVRVRIGGSLDTPKAWLNIKSATLGIERQEYEYEIPVADAEEMLATLCKRPQIDKTRHYVTVAEHLWEIDEFHGDNDGLIVAEIELGSADESFQMPDWAGEDVSGDPRYYNSELIKNPYPFC